VAPRTIQHRVDAIAVWLFGNMLKCLHPRICLPWKSDNKRQNTTIAYQKKIAKSVLQVKKREYWRHYGVAREQTVKIKITCCSHTPFLMCSMLLRRVHQSRAFQKSPDINRMCYRIINVGKTKVETRLWWIKVGKKTIT